MTPRRAKMPQSAPRHAPYLEELVFLVNVVVTGATFTGEVVTTTARTPTVELSILARRPLLRA